MPELEVVMKRDFMTAVSVAAVNTVRPDRSRDLTKDPDVLAI